MISTPKSPCLHHQGWLFLLVLLTAGPGATEVYRLIPAGRLNALARSETFETAKSCLDCPGNSLNKKNDWCQFKLFKEKFCYCCCVIFCVAARTNAYTTITEINTVVIIKEINKEVSNDMLKFCLPKAKRSGSWTWYLTWKTEDLFGTTIKEVFWLHFLALLASLSDLTGLTFWLRFFISRRCRLLTHSSTECHHTF